MTSMKRQRRFRWRSAWWAALAFTGMAALAAGTLPAASAARSATVTAPPYSCAPNGPAGNQTVYGTFGDASVLGWTGNHQGVPACLGGSFFVISGGQPGSGAATPVTGTTYGYGVYDDSPTTWANADGYLPALRDDLPPGRRPHHDHELRRQGQHRRPRLRGHLQPGAGQQPDWPGAQRRSPGVGRAGSAQFWPATACRARHREPRLCGGGGPLRRDVRVAVEFRADRRGRLRPALRAHAGVLEPAAVQHLPDRQPAGRQPGRRVPHRVHLHPDHQVRQPAADRRQRLRHGVQPRRHRDPGQPVHPGLHQRRARAAGPGPVRDRHPDPVRRRGVDLPVGVGPVPAEDR